MQSAPEISKAAFLARVNDRARRFAVDSYYELTDGSGTTALFIVYDNGDREPFRGLDRAA